MPCQPARCRVGCSPLRSREKRKAERAKKLVEAHAEKERIATEAERLAAGNDWRGGADKLRELLDQWKALPRLERSADDALWRRFSGSRPAELAWALAPALALAAVLVLVACAYVVLRVWRLEHRY